MPLLSLLFEVRTGCTLTNIKLLLGMIDLSSKVLLNL